MIIIRYLKYKIADNPRINSLHNHFIHSLKIML